MRTIICHSFPAWDTPYVKSTIELMTRLASTHRVIFIDYHYTWKDIFRNPHCPKAQVLGKKSRWRTFTTPYGQIEVYSTPPVIPINWVNKRWLFKILSGLNGILLRRSLRKVFVRVDLSSAVLVNALNPVYGTLIYGQWNPAKTVYYCYDELKGTPWSNKWGPVYEDRYLPQVDAVICTSEQLKNDKSKLNPNCHVVKNGVNLELFKRPCLNKTQNNSIGYVGAVDNRIDFGLLRYLAQSFAGYQFHFYGPIKVQLEKDLPLNLVFHGAKPQSELPQVIRTMDACIIPFVKNKLTKAIYPLKINEYLAMGKPVVTTHFSDLSDFQKVASIADSDGDFVSALQRALKGNSRLRIQKRIDFVKKNSWEHRAQSFNVILREGRPKESPNSK